MRFDRRFFGIDQLRDAVEYLKLQPQTGFIGLVAETHVRAERFELYAQPMLQLATISARRRGPFGLDVTKQAVHLRLKAAGVATPSRGSPRHPSKILERRPKRHDRDPEEKEI